jgi:3-oxoacyl-[acyl-carrier protein] reductase
MELGLQGRKALVTGASAGLGLACAQALAAEGVEVALVSRSEARLDEAAISIPGARTFAADVADVEQRRAMMERAEQELGQIDIVIANAGGPPPGTFATTEFDAYPDAVALNLLPTIDMCQRFVPAMQQRRWGRIVAITSTSVREPIDRLILSNTARAGLTAFLKTTAREVAGDGVTVNSIQPGLHVTARLTSVYDNVGALAKTVPAQKLGDPADFGRVAAFLCSDSAQFITGVALAVDGGATRGLQ